MKIKVSIVVFIIMLLELVSSDRCQYSNEIYGGKIVCTGIDKDYYISFVIRVLPEIREAVELNENAKFVVEIRDSNFPTLENWILHPWTKIDDLQLKVNSFSIVNSSVTVIEDDSLSGFPLQSLDISYNKLSSYTFLKHTIPKLEFLNISNSHIHNSSNVFEYFRNLNLSIDASNTNIEGAVFLEYFNGFIDLSYNNITTFVSKYRTCSLNLIGNNNLTPFKDYNSYFFYNITLSTVNREILKYLGKLVLKTLAIKKTEVRRLALDNKDSIFLNIFKYPIEGVLDLSNIKITEIDGNYFENYKLLVLNLSYNSIARIKNSSFTYSEINTLDLSHSDVQFLDDSAFFAATFNKLLLSNNKLKSIEGAFNNIKNITEIDLSFNPLEFVNQNSFKQCNFLKSLKLSNSYIASIADDSFASLKNLYYLEISFSNSFSFRSLRNVFLKELAIQNSNIPQLSDNNFDGLYGLKILSFPETELHGVSNFAFNGLVNVKKVKNFKFNLNIDFKVLKSLEELDLSHQNISSLSSSVFKGMHNLKNLNLSNNLLSTLDKDVFMDLENLEVLSLAYNQLVSARALQIGIFRNLRKLTHLYLNNNYNLRLDVLGIFTNLQNLKYLDLSNTNLGYYSLYQTLQPLGRLEFLNVTNAQLYDNALNPSEFNLIASRLSIKKIELSLNMWQDCSKLSSALDYLKDASIDFTPAQPIYDQQNIYGIPCSIRH